MRFWIKLHLALLDDIRFGLLPEFQKWRAIELFLVAGENGDDGLLPPVERLAWRLRLPREKLEETLSALSQAGVVHETPEGWVVTDFQKGQEALTSTERSRYFRKRNPSATKRFKNGNEAAEADSTSTSTSSSFSDSEENEVAEADSTSTSSSFSDSEEDGFRAKKTRAAGDGQGPPVLPRSPTEAMLDPDVRIYSQVTGGRIPGESQYRAVIETLRFLRGREHLADGALVERLKPYWLAWSTRKRRDGRPYDPSNLTWLTEWALNGSIPVQAAGAPNAGEAGDRRIPSAEETRRMMDEEDEKNYVSGDEYLRMKELGLLEKLAHADDP